MRSTINSTASGILSDAVNVLALIESGKQNLDDALDGSLTLPQLRRTTGNLLFLYFRRKRFVDGWIESLASRPPRPRLRRVLAAVLTQIRFQNGIAPESAVNVAVELVKSSGNANEAKFVNAVLRRAVREMPEPEMTPEAVLPPALWKRWSGRFSVDELDVLSAAFLSPAPFTFRAEGDFIPPEEWDAIPLPGREPFRFFESEKPGVVLESEALREGRIYVQDPATAIAASLPDLTAVKSILDVCAAPGGKSLLLAARMNPGTTLTAADRSARRQEQTRQNFHCRKLDFSVITAKPEELTGEYDLVLTDVPCSNSGVFRRRPDALWRFHSGALAEVVSLQRSILEAAAKRVVPGGQLVYSTCSIEEEENDRQIDAFLKTHPEFTRQDSRQELPSCGNDGAYACLLRRSAKSIRT